MNPGILTPPTQYATLPRALLGIPSPIPTVGNQPGFRPDVFAGLVLWLDASEPSTLTVDTTGVISQWASRVGGHVAAQSVSNNRPTLTGLMGGVRVPVFDGSNDRLTITHTAAFAINSYTIYGVVDNDGPATTAVSGFGAWIEKATDSSASGRKFFIGTSPQGFGSFVAQEVSATDAEGGTLRASSGVPRATPTVVALSRRTNGAANLYGNGTLLAADSSTTDLSNTSNINIGGAFYFWNGKVAEVLIYNETHSEQQVRAITEHMRDKWRIYDQ